jgi:D-beta-D-heptose 7-phosphate kinase/D-beta-D-heptose 1-phosphate adenosyltransferase
MENNNRHKIVVIGDVVFDKYVYINPKHANTERGHSNHPIPQYDIVHIDKKLGGAYNVAHLLQNRMTDVDVIFYGIAKPEHSKLIDQNMYKSELFNNNPKGIMSVKQRHVHVDTLYTNSRYDYSIAMDMCSEDDIYNWVKMLSFDADLTIISDYRKGLFNSPKVISHVIANSQRVIVDTKNPNLDLFLGADFIKLNQQEFQDVQEFFGDDMEESIITHKLIITRGDGDTLFIETDIEDKTITEIKIPIDKADQETIVDTIGAGDAFMAGFAWGLVKSNFKAIPSIQEGHRMANINLQKLGASW